MAFPFGPIGFALIAFGTWRDWMAAKSNGPLSVNADAADEAAAYRLSGRRGLGLIAGTPEFNARVLGDKELLKERGVRSIVTHNVGTIDQRVGYIRKALKEGSLDKDVITAARMIVSKKCGTLDGGKRWCIPPKNGKMEALGLFAAITDPNSPFAVRYTNDHYTVDMFSSANLALRVHAEDCFVKGTLVLRDDNKLVPIESVRVGDRIWGLNRWSVVEKTWDKGHVATWLIQLNNGSSMRLTPGHKVWVQRCSKHDGRVAKHGNGSCSRRLCGEAFKNTYRIPVSELREGDIVLRPDSIPFGDEEVDPRRAEIEGYYLSDGWVFADKSGIKRFGISGQDGCPKEAQKARIAELCAELGIRTSMHRKYITVFDREWANRLLTMGGHAPQKHALSLNLPKQAARNLYTGIMADSAKNKNSDGRTLTTTSRELFLQARVLAKMQGISGSENYIVEHGGLGKNPIWRLSEYVKTRADGKSPKLLRVKEIIRDEEVLPCFDIATDDHYVWLPEADWTTSQCDGFAIILGAMLTVIGFPVRLRVIQDNKSSSWSHIYLMVDVAKGGGDWKPLDATEPEMGPFWEVNGANECKLSGRPAGQVVRTRDFPV